MRWIIAGVGRLVEVLRVIACYSHRVEFERAVEALIKKSRVNSTESAMRSIQRMLQLQTRRVLPYGVACNSTINLG